MTIFEFILSEFYWNLLVTKYWSDSVRYRSNAERRDASVTDCASSQKENERYHRYRSLFTLNNSDRMLLLILLLSSGQTIDDFWCQFMH